ncbi:nuclease-related domain-containing protein [Mesobacillus harenae]|uniref:nuclease-related domain-containing protein n=1 Tax=Mesobacillus harenae TaxID=2213203 RepID=UPI001580B874|nr:nuclease-related domain-containing protein [Mesobacillus harenae]
MIAKKRKIPLKILILEALLRRLPTDHRKRQLIEQELTRRYAGYYGEESIDYYLSFLNEKKYLVFHQLRMARSQFFFQIDTLLVSSNFTLLLEIKNISGTITFDNTFDQVTRVYKGAEERMINPILQVKRQQLQYQQWLDGQQLTKQPMEHLVVYCNPTAILKMTSYNPEVKKRICHSEQLYERIQAFESIYKEEPIDKKEIKRLKRLLIKNHEPEKYEILKSFSIESEEIIKGVLCPDCSHTAMKRKRQSWHCPVCKINIKAAYKQAILDYFLIIKDTAINEDIRNFLNLNFPQSIFNFLSNMNFSVSGKTKGRVYHSPFIDY